MFKIAWLNVMGASFFLVVVCSFGLVDESKGANYPGTDVEVWVGDILVGVPNISLRNYFVGHAGIVCESNGNIASILGPGYKLNTFTLDKWFTDSYNTRVLRLKDDAEAQDIGYKAGYWAKDYVNLHQETAVYSIVGMMKDLDKTYCSKVPWLAYWSYGVNLDTKMPMGVIPIHPYDLSNLALHGNQLKK